MFPRQLDIVVDAVFVARTLMRSHHFGSAGKKSETSEHNPIFCNKTAGRSVVAIRRGRHVWNLPHTTGLSGSLSRFSWFGLALVTCFSRSGVIDAGLLSHA